jgi:hypothetical protein
VIPLTGTVTGDMLRAELGYAAGAAIPSLAAVAALRRLTNQPAGTVTLSASRGTALVRSSIANAVAKTICGNPGAAGAYRVVVEPGVNCTSANPAVPALDVGQFPAGSSISIDVYGAVLAAGGLAGSGGAGGRGGDAVKANYSGQTVALIARSGSQLKGGGGGGGKGGAGGTGGTGGQGYYYSYVNEGPTYSAGSYEVSNQQGTSTWTFRWGGSLVGTSSSTSLVVGNVTYSTSSYVTTTSTGSGEAGDQIFTDHYQISRTTQNTNFTAGGGGGAGGAGGSGGRGQGYDGSAAAGSVGSNGNGGAGGGTNAGTGGTGGSGGQGGSGGAYGVAGASGNTGFTGNTGGSGNYTAGSGGSAGAGGSAGGAAGSYLVKGAASVTFTDQGATLAGTQT